MSLRALVQADPIKANELFAKLSDTSDGTVKTREKHFAELKAELELHTSLEEQHLFPVLRRNAETKELVVEAIKDNKALRAELAELEALPKNDKTFSARLKTLQKAFRQHARDEKRELLPAVQHALSEEQVQKVSEKIETGVAEAELAKHEEVEARRAQAERERRQEAERQAEQRQAAKRTQQAAAEQARRDEAERKQAQARQEAERQAEQRQVAERAQQAAAEQARRDEAERKQAQARQEAERQAEQRQAAERAQQAAAEQARRDEAERKQAQARQEAERQAEQRQVAERAQQVAAEQARRDEAERKQAQARQEEQQAERKVEQDVVATRAQEEAEHHAREIMATASPSAIAARTDSRLNVQSAATDGQRVGAEVYDTTKAYKDTARTMKPDLRSVTPLPSIAFDTMAEMRSTWTDWMSHTACAGMQISQDIMQQFAAQQRRIAADTMQLWTAYNAHMMRIARHLAQENFRSLVDRPAARSRQHRNDG